MNARTTERARIAVGVAAPLLLIAALCWPLLFSDATFNEDWLNHLWYLWHQSVAIREGHTPSLFLDSASGLFYPFYAFYGGTLYAATGLLSLALGDAPLHAYVLTFVLDFVAAYGGWYWLACAFGLRGWTAHVPGVVFVTSAPYLTTIYGLGDWPEFTAVSTMPLLIASILAVLRAPQLRLWPALALAGSGTLFFGSHLLTGIWGTTVLVLVAVAILFCIPQARHRATPAAVLRVAVILVPAALVNAWFLLPTAAYEAQTVIAHNYPHFRELLRTSAYTVAARHLFTLSRARDSGTVLTLALPVLAIVWTAATAVLLLATRRRGPLMRALLVCAVAAGALLVLMTHVGLILALPRIYATLQFSFRLESYILLGISATLLLALALLDEAPALPDPPAPRITPTLRSRESAHARRWRLLLVPIVLLSVLGAIEQVSSFNHQRSRRTALASYTQPTFEREGLLNYVDDELPIVRKPLPQLRFASGHAPGTPLVASIGLGAGQRVDSNIRSSPDFVRIQGARIVATDAQANDVLELTDPSHSARDPTSTATRVTVSGARSAPILAGRLIALAALLALIGELAAVALRTIRVRRRRPSAVAALRRAPEHYGPRSDGSSQRQPPADRRARLGQRHEPPSAPGHRPRP